MFINLILKSKEAVLRIIIVIIVILFAFALSAVFLRLLSFFGEKMSFYSLGRENEFCLSEIRILWKNLKRCGIFDPLSMYTSVPVLNTCIALIVSERKRSVKNDDVGINILLAKLNKLRAKVALEKSNQNSAKSTEALEVGQRICIIYYGEGVFVSKVLNNGKLIAIELPKKLKHAATQRSEILPPSIWKNKKVSVYFWRKNDACYAFDTTVSDIGMYEDKTAIFLNECSKLDRTQKRQSVRCICAIDALISVIKSAESDYSNIETDGDCSAVIENISEYGALIRIDGKAPSSNRIKLQFTINRVSITMYGIIHSSDYDREKRQSLLHFECTHVDDEMHTALLNYIYTHIDFETGTLEGVETVDYVSAKVKSMEAKKAKDESVNESQDGGEK